MIEEHAPDTDPQLATLAAAETLEWVPHTVFVPGGGADGSVYGVAAGERVSVPVDIFSPAELTRDVTEGFSEGLGVIVAAPRTQQDAIDAVRRWCREHLGRDDVALREPWETATQL